MPALGLDVGDAAVADLPNKKLIAAGGYEPRAQLSKVASSTHTEKKMAQQQAKADRKVLRIAEVCERTGLSRSGIYDRLNQGSKYYSPEFPQRFKIGLHSVGWDSTEIDLWIAAQKERGIIRVGH